MLLRETKKQLKKPIENKLGFQKLPYRAVEIEVVLKHPKQQLRQQYVYHAHESKQTDQRLKKPPTFETHKEFAHPEKSHYLLLLENLKRLSSLSQKQLLTENLKEGHEVGHNVPKLPVVYLFLDARGQRAAQIQAKI
jgi:hypothetical protein